MKTNYKFNLSGRKEISILRFLRERNSLVVLATLFLAVLLFYTFAQNTTQAGSSALTTSQLSALMPAPTNDPVTGCADNYTALGGVINSNPTAGVINGRVVVFARGTDGAIYFQYSSGFTFSGWISLGGNTNSAPMSIVIGSTLYVEVIGTDNNRYYRSTTNGGGFTDWTQGTVGATVNPNAILGTVSYSFARGASGTQPNLCALIITGATPSPTATPTATPTGGFDAVTGCPTGYTALGGVITSNPTTGTVNNRVIVFARGTDGEIYYQYSGGGSFSGWNRLRGATNSDPMSVVIGATLYVEVVGTDGKRYYKSSPDGLGYTDWIQGTVGATTKSTTTLGTTGYTFIRGSAGTQPNLCTLVTPGVAPTPTPTVTPTATPTPTGNFDAVTGCATNYTALGGVITSSPSAAVVNGRVVAFARGTDGALYTQSSIGTVFTGFINLGGAITTATPRTIVSSGILYVEVTGTDGNNYYRSTTDGINFTAFTQGTFGATVNPSAILGTTSYTFAIGSAGSQPNLCTLITGGVVGATPTPTPNQTTGCASDYVSLGGIINADPTTSIFNGKVFVFARGTDGAIYYQTSTGGVFTGFTGLGGGSTSNPKSIVVGSTLYVEVVGTDTNSYYRSTTDGVTFTDWKQGTFSATTNPSSAFGGKTYTFAKGISNTPHLCVKIQ